MQNVLSVLAHEPHAARCQLLAAPKSGPLEVLSLARQTALVAVSEPEPSMERTPGTVAETIVVVVAVDGRKLHVVVVCQCVRSGVSHELRDLQPIIGLFSRHHDGTVLGPVL